MNYLKGGHPQNIRNGYNDKNHREIERFNWRRTSFVPILADLLDTTLRAAGVSQK